jgi:hypothetical protein
LPCACAFRATSTAAVECGAVVFKWQSWMRSGCVQEELTRGWTI